jgi:hypothetical protein
MNDLMRYKVILLKILLLALACMPWADAMSQAEDTIDVQKLFNGRAWKNMYYRIKGDQFLFSPDFIPGNVTIENTEYKNLKLRYDIYNDEIVTVTNHGILLQLNKEMVDNFKLNWNGRLYFFKRIDSDSTSSLHGFANVLYEGRTTLYVKNIKEILLLAVDNKYDMFNQVNRVYLVKDDNTYRINSRMEFFKLIKDRKSDIRQFIRSNKIKVSKKDPDSFVPVLEYYDKIQQSK